MIKRYLVTFIGDLNLFRRLISALCSSTHISEMIGEDRVNWWPENTTFFLFISGHTYPINFFNPDFTNVKKASYLFVFYKPQPIYKGRFLVYINCKVEVELM